MGLWCIILIFPYLLIDIVCRIEIYPVIFQTGSKDFLSISFVDIPELSSDWGFQIQFEEGFESTDECIPPLGFICQNELNGLYSLLPTQMPDNPFTVKFINIITSLTNQTASIFVSGTNYNDEQFSQTTYIYLTPQIFRDYNVQFSNVTTASEGSMQIRLNSESINSSSLLRVVMPDYNPKASSNNQKYFINSINTSCIDLVTQQALQCTVKYDRYLDIVLSNGCTDIEIQNVLSPLTNNYNPINIYQMDSDHKFYNIWMGQYLHVSEVVSFEKVLLNCSSLASGQNNIINVSIQISVEIPMDESLIIEIPIELTQSSSNIQFYTLDGVQMIHWMKRNIYIIDNMNSDYLYAGSWLEFKINGLVNPPISGDGLQFMFYITDPTNIYYYQKLNTSIYLTYYIPEPNNISYFTVSFNNYTVDALTNMIINFKIEKVDLYSLQTILSLNIPTQIRIQDELIEFQGFAPSLKYTLIGNQLLIQNGLSSQTTQFQLIFKVQVANNTAVSDSFELYTSKNGIVIDQLNDRYRVQMQPIAIGGIQFYSISQICDLYNNHRLQFNVGWLSQNSTVRVWLPSYYTDQIRNNITLYCFLIERYVRQVCTVIDGDEYGISIPINYGGEIIIQFQGFKSYRTTEIRDELIKIIIFDQMGMVFAKSDFSTTTKLQDPIPNTFATYQLELSDYTQDTISNYTFNISYNQQLLDSDQLIMVLPFNIPFQTVCYPLCKILDQNSILFQVNQLRTQTNNLIGIVQLLNTVSTPKNFLYMLQTTDEYLIARYTDQIGIIKQLIDTDFTFLYSISPNFINSQTTLSVIWEQKQILPAKSTIILKFYQSGTIQYNNLACNGNLTGIIICEELPTSNNTYLSIQVSLISNNLPSYYQIDFTGLYINAQIPQIQQSIIQLTAISPELQEQQSITISETLSYICSSQCNECLSQYDQCSSCGEGLILYRGQCISSCPAQMTVISYDQKTCIQCQTSKSCLECSQIDTQICTLCSAGFILIDGYCSLNQTSVIIVYEETVQNEEFLQQEELLQEEEDQVQQFIKPMDEELQNNQGISEEQTQEEEESYQKEEIQEEIEIEEKSMEEYDEINHNDEEVSANQEDHRMDEDEVKYASDQSVQQSSPNNRSPNQNIQLNYDIPIFTISLGMTIIFTTVLKILQPKSTIFHKTLYTTLSTTEIPYHILMISSFALQQNLDATILSIVGIMSTMLLQLHSFTQISFQFHRSLILRQYMQTKGRLGEMWKIGTQYFQWKLILNPFDQQNSLSQDKQLKEPIILLLKLSSTNQLIQILIGIEILLSQNGVIQ